MSYQRGNSILAGFGVDTAGIIKSYTGRRLDRKPKKSFDGDMYDAIKSYLDAADKHLAKEVHKAIEDDRITKNFCEESKLYEQVERFTNLKSFRKSMQGMDSYEWAKRILLSMLPDPKQHQLKPLELREDTDVNEIFSNPDASAGYLAYPLHKRESGEIIKKVALRIIKDYDKKVSFPAIALTRSQITDFVEDGTLNPETIKYKTRLVMCVDAASVLVEQRFGQPLLDFIMKSQPQYTGGKDDYETRRILLDMCRDKRWISLDYSKFDATIQAWLIKDVFSILSAYFPQCYQKDWDWICNNFINMQLLMPNGHIIDLHKGIKSGSYFTQIVGSLCNILMIFTYLCYKFGTRVGKKIVSVERVYTELYSHQHPGVARYLTIVAMGDDNIFFTEHPIDVKDMATYLKHNFGTNITMEGEKGVDSGLPWEAPHFLKRVWKRSGQEREPLEMFVNLLHPERRRSYDGYSVWHIIFGYYLTFEGTMSRYIKRQEILELMHNNGGIEALAKVKLGELPGSLRSQILNRGVNRDELVKKLKREYFAYRAS